MAKVPCTASMSPHVCNLVSPLCLPCINWRKLQYRNYQQLRGGEALLTIYFSLSRICQYLSALNVTVRIMANESLLSVYFEKCQFHNFL